MLKRKDMWMAVLFLVPACCSAGQAVPDIVPQNQSLASVENDSSTPAQNQVEPVTGMRRSSQTATLSPGWALSEAGQVSRGYDSNPLTYISSPDDMFTKFSGTVRFIRSRVTGALDLAYTGGGVQYSRLDSFSQTFHRAKLEKTFLSPRWNVLASDDFKYLPDAPRFVFGTDGGASGTSSAGPGDLVLVGNNQPFYSNVALMEASHTSSARTSFTGSFSYGLLRFVNTGYVGNDSYNYSAGYNHLLTRRNTLGIRYTDKRFQFQDSPVTVVSHSPAFVLQHRVRNRFLAYLGSGPEMYSISGKPYRPVTHWTWAADAGLEYTVSHSTFALSYTHGTSSGSGVLVGSELHAATGRVEQRFSDHWSGSAEGSWWRGVAITPGLPELSTLTVAMGGVGIDHRIFATESAFIRYSYASGNRPPSCTELSCIVGISRQMVEVGIKLSHSSAHEIHPEGN